MDMSLTQKLYRHAKERIPGGVGLLSKRPENMAPDYWPAYSAEAHGCTIKDLDGRTYRDFSSNGIGACLLGYADPFVSEAVIRTVRSGSMSSLNPPEEVELADRLCAIHPWAEQVRFARTGGETLALAVRIARAATDRSIVVVSGYHGWSDWYLACNLGDSDALRGMWLAGVPPYGVPSELRGTSIPLTHGDFARLEELFTKFGNKIAAVVAEPCRRMYPTPGFLEKMRALCNQYGSALIFDEVTIGWRWRFGGSHLSFGVTPDLAAFAKALGNGHPIGAVIGTRQMMQSAEKSFISSTYWTERVGPVAALATLQRMEESRVWEHAQKIGAAVVAHWKRLAAKYALPLVVQSEEDFACLAAFSFSGERAAELRTLYTRYMIDEGFLAGSAFYPTLAHSEKDVSDFGEALDRVFAKLRDALDAKQPILPPEAIALSGFQRLVK